MAKSDSELHKGHRQRMREKFRKYGFDGFADHEVVEMLLFYCYPRMDTNKLAHKILDKYGSLADLFDASPEELMIETGISEVTATLFSMISKLSKVYEKSKWDRVKYLKNTEETGQFAVSMFTDTQNEEFALICLDANRRICWSGVIIKGTVDRTEAYPRIVVKEALKHQATKVVFVHNHPSGTLSASVADKEATEVLIKTLKCIDIEVLDHIIVSGTRYLSMKEMGFRF